MIKSDNLQQQGGLDEEQVNTSYRLSREVSRSGQNIREQEVELQEVTVSRADSFNSIGLGGSEMREIDLHDLGNDQLRDGSGKPKRLSSLPYGRPGEGNGLNNNIGHANGDDAMFMDDGRVCTSDEERFALVDRAFDEMGAGRFHIMLFFSAAVGFMVEAAEMNMLSILLPKFKQVWGVEDTQLSIIASFTGLGMIFGVLLFGRLSDIIGRKKVFHMCLTLCVIMGFISSFANNVTTFAVMRLFLGFAYGGNTVSASTLLIESVPTAWRGFFSAMVSFAFTFGYISVVLLAWAVMEPLGWQWLVRLVAFFGIPAVYALNFVPESVRFCVLRENYEECVRIVKRIAYHNRVPVPSYFTVERLSGVRASDISADPMQEAGQIPLKGIEERFSFRKMCRTIKRVAYTPPLVPLMLVWFLNSFAQNIIQFMPLELKERFPDVKDSTYKVALALSMGGFIGSLVVLFLASRVRRKTELRMGFAIMAVCIMIVTHADTGFGFIIMILICNHIGMSIIYHGLYTYTPEVFPTPIRVTCFSICQMSHRLAPVLAPFLVTYLAEKSFALCGTVFACIFLLAFLVASFGLRRETFGAALVEDSGKRDDLDPIQSSGFKTVGRLDRVDTSGSLSSTESTKLSDDTSFSFVPSYSSDVEAVQPNQVPLARSDSHSTVVI